MNKPILDADLLGVIVTKVLHKFDEWNLKHSDEKLKYRHIDITLSKNGKNHSVQVTNYGQFTRNVLHFLNNIFNDLISKNIFLRNSQIATIYTGNEYDDCQTTVSLYFATKHLSLTKRTINESQIDFSHQKNYLSLQLEHKLSSRDLDKFLKVLSNEIIILQRLRIETKFTIHCDRNVIYNNYISLDNDYKSCQAFASALTNIIKHSVNIEFKENCFTVLGVNNSHNVETVLMIKLLPLIHNNYTFSNNS